MRYIFINIKYWFKIANIRFKYWPKIIWLSIVIYYSKIRSKYHKSKVESLKAEFQKKFGQSYEDYINSK